MYHKKEEEEALGVDKFLNGRISYLANRLHGSAQILFQIAVLFSRVHTNICIVSSLEWLKLARFRGSRVNERRIRASFCPFKNLCGPVLYGVLVCFTFNVDGSD